MSKGKAISLFSGMGGDSLGIVNSGFDLVAYSEKERVMRQTHDLNFENCQLIGNGDITKTPDSEFKAFSDNVDLIFAGFPCQGFSNGGKKDPNDPRNSLFREFVRVAQIIKPKYIIGENVKGLLARKTQTGEAVIDIITQEFEKLGYVVNHRVFKCHRYGVPQKRERLLIVGILQSKVGKSKADGRIRFPAEHPEKEIPDLTQIVKFDMTGTIQITQEDFDWTTIPEECIVTDMTNDEEAGNPHPYLKMKVESRDVPYPKDSPKTKIHHTLLSFGKRDSPIHCEVVDIRRPAKTIICTYDHQPRFFVIQRNKKGYFLRCLLPDELKQIQGFPADYQLSGNIKQQIVQIGNAVPPPLIKEVVETLTN